MKKGKRWSSGIFWAAVALVVVGVGFGWLLVRRGTTEVGSDPQPHTHASVPTPHPREVYTRLLEVVHLSDDPRGEIVQALYQLRGAFSRLDGGGLVTITEDRVVPPGGLLPIIVATREERLANGHTVFQLWQFDSLPSPLMFVPPVGTHSDVWGGAVFAHELSHAYDVMTGVDPPGMARNDPRFLDGEIRAYELEFRLLDRLTGGRLGSEIAAAVRESESGAGERAWIVPGTRAVDRINALFAPIQSPDERAVRHGAYSVFINLLLADRRGQGQEGKREFMYFIMNQG